MTYTPQHLAEKILTSKAAMEGERKQVTALFADTIKAKIARDGEFKSKAGVVRKLLGRPNVSAAKVAKAQDLLPQGNGILKVGRLVGLGSGTVQRVKRSALLAAHRAPQEIARGVGTPAND